MSRSSQATRESYYEVVEDFRAWCSARGLSFPQEMALLIRFRMGCDLSDETRAVEMSGQHEDVGSQRSARQRVNPTRERNPGAPAHAGVSGQTTTPASIGPDGEGNPHHVGVQSLGIDLPKVDRRFGKWSDERRQQMSERMKGRKRSPEEIEKFRAAMAAKRGEVAA